jgi:AcrR family transcriptional regulator
LFDAFDEVMMLNSPNVNVDYIVASLSKHCQHGGMENRNYHHGNLKAELISSALSLAEGAGIDAITIRQLARDTNVTPAAALRHFEDLAHLKADISQEARQELGRQCLSDLAPLEASALTPEVAVARFDLLARRYVTFSQNHRNLFNTAFAICTALAELPDDPSPWALLESVVEDLVAVGLISDSLRSEAGLIAWSMVHGLATLESHNLIHVSGFEGDLGDFVLRSLHAALFRQ